MKTMNFDLEYKLQQFREEQHELFDENGERYTASPISKRNGETMLQLINELESALLEEYAKQSVTDCTELKRDEVQEYLNDNVIDPNWYSQEHLGLLMEIIGLKFINERKGWQPLPEPPKEERIISCTSCKWQDAKYDYKCDECIKFNKYEQDTEEGGKE